MNKRALVLVLCALVFEASCTLHGRLYNMTTGEVTPVTMTYSGSGKGKLSAVVPSSGEKVSGEYITFAHIPVNWGSIYAKVYGTEGTSYTSGSSEGKSNQYGTAIATGDNRWSIASMSQRCWLMVRVPARTNKAPSIS